MFSCCFVVGGSPGAVEAHHGVVEAYGGVVKARHCAGEAHDAMEIH